MYQICLLLVPISGTIISICQFLQEGRWSNSKRRSSSIY